MPAQKIAFAETMRGRRAARSGPRPDPPHVPRPSLIELAIAVVIIGAIAALAVTRVTEASRDATAAGIAAHLRRLAAAFELDHAGHGAWPSGPAAGTMPAEMAGRIDPGAFGPTPSGGEHR